MKNELKAMFTEHWKYLAVSAACELTLFDKIHEGQNSFGKLIKVNKWQSHALFNLLHYLLQSGYIKEIESKIYVLTEKGNLLRRNNPDGLYFACLNWSGEHLVAWQNLRYVIETGKSSFEKNYGLPFFDYLNEHPEKLIAYHRAMFEYAINDYKALADVIDFSQHQSVMDIGGGFGAALSIVKNKYPHLKCILFDLEKVIQHVPLVNLEKINGSFFDRIPIHVDSIILSRVLHDWNDAKAQIIITNCYNALAENGTLYIIENCTDKIDIDLSLLSLNMMAICDSYERSSSSYISLAQNTNFKYQKEIKLNTLQTILIFKK